MISIIGLKNAGRRHFSSRSRRSSSPQVPRDDDQTWIARGRHGSAGKDTWRHWHEGEAERVLMESPDNGCFSNVRKQNPTPSCSHGRYLGGADIVLVEGFSACPFPRSRCIAPWRARSRSSIPRSTILATGVAMVTDDRRSSNALPCLSVQRHGLARDDRQSRVGFARRYSAMAPAEAAG